MMSKWGEAEIGQLTTKIGSGATPRGGSNAYLNKGISLIRSQNVLDLRFSVNGLAFIDEDQAKALNNVAIERDDILLNITGDSVARVCKVPDFVIPARVNQHVAILRADQPKLDSDFLLYYLISQKEELLSMSEIGATRKAITKRMIEQFKITLPELSEQKAIASVLSCLDDKIDLLHRQNQTLEQMAETLFRQWFVEEADERWEETVLGEFVSTNGTSINKNYPFQEIEYLDTGSLTRGKWGNLQSFSLDGAPSRAKRLVQHNDILYSTVRPNQLHYGIVRNPIENLVVSTGFCVITCQEISPYFVYYLLTDKGMTEYLHSIAEGSTSAYPSLKPSDIEDLEFMIPPVESLKKFHAFVDTAWNKIETNYTQIRTLTALRDTLLPKLMNGEVRVADTPVISLKKSKEVRPEFKEAILIAVIVHTLFTPKIGNVSRQWYQKIAYLHKRKLKELTEQQSVFELTTEYSKKAAGPYKKKMRYQGPESICLKNKYLEAVNNYAFKPSEDIHKIDNYFDNYWNKDLFVNWTIEKLRFIPVKKLGVYATVDYSLLELKKEGKELSASNVLHNISESKDWKHKKDLPEFSPQNIEEAINDLKNLYSY